MKLAFVRNAVEIEKVNTIHEVANELSNSEEQLYSLSIKKRNSLAEYSALLCKFYRVARKLQAERKLTLFRAPCLLDELRDTKIIMERKMDVRRDCSNRYIPLRDEEDTLIDILALPLALRLAHVDNKLVLGRQNFLKKNYARQIASLPALKLERNL